MILKNAEILFPNGGRYFFKNSGHDDAAGMLYRFKEENGQRTPQLYDNNDIERFVKVHKLLSMVQFSVYVAYCLMAIPAGLVIARWGYRRGVVLGLSLFAIANHGLGVLGCRRRHIGRPRPTQQVGTPEVPQLR
nr:unnamed protein product [uncultured bacterium]